MKKNDIWRITDAKKLRVGDLTRFKIIQNGDEWVQHEARVIAFKWIESLDGIMDDGYVRIAFDKGCGAFCLNRIDSIFVKQYESENDRNTYGTMTMNMDEV